MTAASTGDPQKSDDLTAISGIGAARAKLLRESLGVHTFQDLASLSTDEIESQLREQGQFVSRDDIERWRAQAQELASAEGNDSDQENVAPSGSGWESAATFVVEFQVSEEGKDRRTRVHHMEDDVDSDWPDFEHVHLCRWMLEQLGEPVPDLPEDILAEARQEVEQMRTDARQELQEELEAERSRLQQEIEQELEERTAEAHEALQEEISEARTRAQREMDEELEAERNRQQEAFEENLEERKAQAQDALQQELEETRTKAQRELDEGLQAEQNRLQKVIEEELEEQRAEAQKSLDQDLQQARADARQELQEELEAERDRLQKEIEQELEERKAEAQDAFQHEVQEARTKAQEQLDEELEAERARLVQEMEQELEERRAEAQAALEQESEQLREEAREALAPELEEPAEEEEAPEPEPEVPAEVESAPQPVAVEQPPELKIAEFRVYQPPQAETPRVVGKSPSSPDALRRDIPFSLVGSFSVDEAQADELAGKGATYTAQFHIREISTGETRQLATIGPDAFTASKSTYEATLANVSLPAGLYLLTAFVSTDTTPPGGLFRQVSTFLVA